MNTANGQVPGQQIQYPELVSEMAKREITKRKLASVLGVTFKTLSSRLHGKSSFTLAEAKKIHETFFPDTDFMDLFSLK